MWVPRVPTMETIRTNVQFARGCVVNCNNGDLLKPTIVTAVVVVVVVVLLALLSKWAASGADRRGGGAAVVGGKPTARSQALDGA